MARQQLEEYFNLEPPKFGLYQLTRTFSSDIASPVSSALRDLIVIFEKSILYSSPKLLDTDPAGTLYYNLELKMNRKYTE